MKDCLVFKTFAHGFTLVCLCTQLDAAMAGRLHAEKVANEVCDVTSATMC